MKKKKIKPVEAKKPSKPRTIYSKLKPGMRVRILKETEGSINSTASVIEVDNDVVWVSNLMVPPLGTLSKVYKKKNLNDYLAIIPK